MWEAQIRIFHYIIFIDIVDLIVMSKFKWERRNKRKTILINIKSKIATQKQFSYDLKNCEYKNY